MIAARSCSMPLPSPVPAGGQYRWPALLLALSLTGCSEPPPADTPPRPVRVTTIHYDSAMMTARYSGEVKVRYETPLSFQVGGKIARRHVEVGTSVARNALLATLDAADFQLRRASAQAQLAAARAELDQAKKDLRHLDNLRSQELASEAGVERRMDTVKAAEARVHEAVAAVDLHARQSAYTELRADHAGVITSVDAEAGQVVSAGQTIVRLAQTDEKEVVIQVPENRLDALRAATELQVSLWAAPEALFPARVREISPGVDALIRTYTVKVSLLQRDPRIRMGMTATVHVQRAEPQPVATLPLTAIYRDGNHAAVWVVDSATRTVQLHPVTISRYETETAKVLDGPAEGQWVVTAGVHKLRPEQPVRLLEADEAP